MWEFFLSSEKAYLKDIIRFGGRTGTSYGIWLSKGDQVEVWQALIEATSGDSAVADSLAPDDQIRLLNHSTQRSEENRQLNEGSVLWLFSLFQFQSSPVRYYTTLYGSSWKGVRSCNGTSLPPLLPFSICTIYFRIHLSELDLLRYRWI